MLASGAAFACYCKAAAYAGGDAATSEEDREGEGDDEGTKAYKAAPCPCREFSDDQRAERERAAVARAIRFRVAREGVTKFEDAVFGPREIRTRRIEDFVLLRSNGVPTYQLSVVVDEHRHAHTSAM